MREAVEEDAMEEREDYSRCNCCGKPAEKTMFGDKLDNW